MGIMAVVQQIVVMLLIAGVGLELRRREMLDQAGMRGVNLIVLNAALPAMILMVTQQAFSPDAKRDFLVILAAGLGTVFVTGVVLRIAARKWLPEKRQAVFAGLCAMPNAGFMGLPLVSAMYGAPGALLLAAYIMAFNLLLFTQFEGYFDPASVSVQRMATNLGLVACVVSLALFMLDIRLPHPVPSLLNQLGSLTTPLSMLLAGARMREFRVKDLREPSLWAIAALRLVVIPLAVFAVMRALGLSGLVLGVLVLASSMPPAVSGLMFAERYRKDTVYAATGVSLATVLCVVTIPFVLWVTGV